MQLKHAFIFTLAIKISSSFLAWEFHQPWVLGFYIPLAVMLIYMVYGWNVTRHSPREERLSYGDSCYYLGFLFTITSIILAMADLRSETFNLQDIAIRFAAAMVTTLLGMAMRVYLVTFSGENEKSAAKILGLKGSDQAGEKSESAEKSTEEEESKPIERPVDVSVDDGVEVVISASLHNFKLLNDKMREAFDGMDKLRGEVLLTSARLTNEMNSQAQQISEFYEKMEAHLASETDLQAQQIKEFFEKADAHLNDSMNEKFQLLENGMQSTLAKTEEGVQSLLSKTESSLQAISDAVKATAEKNSQVLSQALADGSQVITRASEELANSLKLDNHDNLLSTLNTLATKLDALTQKVVQSSDNYNVVFDESLKKLSLQMEQELQVLSRHLGTINDAVDSKAVADKMALLNNSLLQSQAAMDSFCQSVKSIDSKMAEPNSPQLVQQIDALNNKLNQLSRSLGDLEYAIVDNAPGSFLKKLTGFGRRKDR